MIDQKASPSGDGTKRDGKGRWLVGTPAPNPAGNNGNRRKGFVSWRTRVEQLSEKYPTVGDIIKFFILDQWGRPKPTPALCELNDYDAGIIWQRICQNFGSAEINHKSRESFWDRYEGTPTQTVRVQTLATRLEEIPTQFSTDEEAARAFEELIRTNGL